MASIAVVSLGSQEKTVRPKQKPYILPAVSLIAGGVAGGIEATITYPFEFAKTQAQLRSNKSVSRNPLAVVVGVARHNGFRAIYTGCSTLILGTTFKASVRFLSFDSIKNVLADGSGKLSASGALLAGMVAGCVESLVAVTPTERIKTALIDDANGAKRYRGGLHAARLILHERGIPGLYRGLLSTTAKQSATSAVRMGSYNILRETARQYKLPNNSAITFGTGAIAGIITVYATQPFDTIKTRAQSATGASSKEAFRSILQSAGVRGFWNGSTMRLGRLIFSGGIVFTVYENVASVLASLSFRHV